MAFNEKLTATPKANCVKCGSPSKWICPGCKQWYCQKCAPMGLCEEHFHTLDYEDQEFLRHFYPDFMKKIKIIPILVFSTFLIIFISIFSNFLMKIPSNLMIYMIIGTGVACFVPLFLLILPIMKNMSKLLKIARIYRYSSSSNASYTSSFDDTKQRDYGNNRPASFSYSSNPNSNTFQPIRNLDTERQTFSQVPNSIVPTFSWVVPIGIFIIILTIVVVILMLYL